jgi:hypothetical protein
MVLKDGEYKIIKNFLTPAGFRELNAMASTANPMFYAPYITEIDESGDDYFVHRLYGKYEARSELFELFSMVCLDRGTGVTHGTALELDALMEVKIKWYPRTPEIQEYETFTKIKCSVDNIILFMTNDNGYVKLPDGTKINSAQNKALVYKGNPKDVVHSTHTTEDSYLRSVWIIQGILRTLPVEQEVGMIKY